LHRVVATLDITKSGSVPTFPFAFSCSLVLLISHVHSDL